MLQTFFLSEIVRKKTGKRETRFFEKEGILKREGFKKGRQDPLLDSQKFYRGKLIQLCALSCRLFLVLFLQKHRLMLHPYIW